MELRRLTQAPRSMFASSIPTVFGFSKTQPPMVSWPMSSTAGTVSPCLATIIAALPAAPDTASVKSSTKSVLPPGGIRVTGRQGRSRAIWPTEVLPEPLWFHTTS